MIEGQRDACWNFLVNGLWLTHRKNLRDELEAKREELHALATDFHSHLPPDIQNEVTNTPRSFQAVINASEKLRSSWETRSETNKFAKARMYMRKVGTAISNHSNFLKILPSSNDYTSVFCGALTVLITVLIAICCMSMACR